MLLKVKSVVATLLIATVPALALAHDTTPVSSKGGVMIGSPESPYWFELNGVIKLDQRNFFGDKAKTINNTAGTYVSGSFIRDIGLDLGGGIGQDFSYTLSLNLDSKDSKIKADDAYVTYYGFRDLMPNFTVSVGQVIPGFCIACASSSKWIPFMERSMATNTFGPQQGMGVSVNSYANNYSATVAATQQPRSGSTIKSVSGADLKRNDLWQGSGRFTFAPIAEATRVLQVGLSAHVEEFSNTGLELSTTPEMRTPNSTTLLNTTSVTPGGVSTLIAARNQKTIDLEISGVNGPWSGEAEYQKTYVSRGIDPTTRRKQGANLKFHGYHAQVSYVLTGESRPHKKSNGTFGQIKPHSKKGAWELSARYSVLDLNDKDIFGGKARNTTTSISWYANNNVRVIAEYIFSKQKRKFPTYLDKRHVNGLGARLQIVF